jgi:hypothetical protein
MPNGPRFCFLKVCVFILLFFGAGSLIAQTVRIETAAPINSINPRESVGAGVDRIPVEAIDRDLTRQALAPVLECGWQPITYRQNTELAVEAWHWNPEGTWSNPSGKRYFTGSTTSTGFTRHSFGYALPNRGVTRNDGTGNTGFSRISDGDESTYWKSNPYFTSRYTGEADELHPQLVILDLSREELVETLKISWAQPYATDYILQYWIGLDPLHFPTRSAWVTLPRGIVTGGRGGLAVHKLSDLPARLRFLRSWMTKSSNTCDSHGSADARNCVGYAINELYLRDGQYMLPEDYAARYLQYATALRRVDDHLKLGGPSFQGVNEDIEVWPDAQGRTSWLARFLSYLRQHTRMQDLQFFSFEHYPYEPRHITWGTLYDEPELTRHIVDVWHTDGLPGSVPFFITQSNLSSSTSETYEDIFSGLWLADYVGSFLSSGGSGIYYFHYLPLQFERGCNDSAGTFGMFTVHPDYSIDQPLAQFFVSQLINHEWLQADGVNQVFPASTDISDGAGHVLVTAYAVKRPDGQWSVMLINKDQNNGHRVRAEFAGATGSLARFRGPVEESLFGSDQYHWVPSQRQFNAHLPESLNGPQHIYHGGVASPDGPIVKTEIPDGNDFDLPAASVTILRGKL